MQEIEFNRALWSALFEPYLFFEAYKNYLEVDIVAADADDFLAWKGWVESRFRQLTLKVWICLQNVGANGYKPLTFQPSFGSIHNNFFLI